MLYKEFICNYKLYGINRFSLNRNLMCINHTTLSNTSGTLPPSFSSISLHMNIQTLHERRMLELFLVYIWASKHFPEATGLPVGARNPFHLLQSGVTMQHIVKDYLESNWLLVEKLMRVEWQCRYKILNLIDLYLLENLKQREKW